MVLARVDPPLIRKPVYSLLVVAEVIANVTPREYVQGWTFLPEQCSVASGRMAVECGGTWAAITPGAPAAVVDGMPFAVWAADPCRSTFGYNRADSVARSRRALEAWESYQVANELWTGSTSEAEAYGNLSFAGLATESDTVTTAALAPLDALARVSGALSKCVGRGMIHVTPQVLEVLGATSVIHREGNLWVSAMGHVIVADGGYDGSGPDNAAPTTSQWIYGSTMVSVMLSPVQIAGDTDDQIDVATNSVLTYAWRMAGIKWDGCCLFAAEVNVVPPAVGGAG